MLAQLRPDEQVYLGPTSVSNVGPTESTAEILRWPNVVMLSGLFFLSLEPGSDTYLYQRHCTGVNLVEEG